MKKITSNTICGAAIPPTREIEFAHPYPMFLNKKVIRNEQESTIK
jgi:hypothetical protein